MSIYSLTHLTGRRRNDDRRLVIARFEVRRAPFFASLAGAVAGAPLAGITAPLFGVWSLVWLAIGAAAANLLFVVRQRGSMQLRHFEAIRNSMRASGRLGAGRKTNPLKGVFLIGGRPFREHGFVLSQPVLAWHGEADHDLMTLDQRRRRRPR